VAALHTPTLFARGRWWTADEVDAIARRLHHTMVRLVADAPLAAIVVPRSVDAVAFVLAATALPSTLMMLPPDPRAWRTDPAIPAATPFVLMPELAALAPDVERVGGRACVLGETPAGEVPSIPLMQTPGMVWFTSGSTGLAKPVYRTAASVLALVDQRFAALPPVARGGIVSGDSLAHGQGLIEFLLSCRVGGAFAPLDPLNLRAALNTLARPEFTLWFTTPQVADAICGVPTEGTPVVPPFCFVAGGATRRTADAFVSRFGRELRQHYGTSEGGLVAIDADETIVRRSSVGRLVERVEVRVGEHPGSPLANGTPGRLWIRSRGQMEGYGFPPDIDRSDMVDGWCPSRDLGTLGNDGYLTLAGRMDDCIRVRDGRLVNLALVAGCLRDADGVTDAAVVPIDQGDGLTFGAVVEGTPALEDVRQHVSAELPPWCWPRSLVLVPAIPRLANGKIDRGACGALLLERAAS
jgi:long-chain acyl-CoA synthetase